MDGVPVYTPTYEEFKVTRETDASPAQVFTLAVQDFNSFVRSIEPQAAKIGLAKVIPPKEWNGTKQNYPKLLAQSLVHAPIRQHVSGQAGVYQFANVVEAEAVTVDDFKEGAELGVRSMSRRDQVLYDNEDWTSLERTFWKNLAFHPALYGADSPGTLFGDEVTAWNVRHLNTILDIVGATICGVTTPFLYWGQWKSAFAWHVEDMNLHSINYLHLGKPKQWYVVEPGDYHKMERLCQSHFPQLHRHCPEFLRHKTSLISPALLQRNNIRVHKCIQYPGEFMITFPKAFHGGFNYGFNVAESTNFATEFWIDKGLEAGVCYCVDHSVAIDMTDFTRRLRQYQRRRSRPTGGAEQYVACPTEEGDAALLSDSDTDQSENRVEDVEPSKSIKPIRSPRPSKPAKTAKPVVRTIRRVPRQPSLTGYVPRIRAPLHMADYLGLDCSNARVLSALLPRDYTGLVIRKPPISLGGQRGRKRSSEDASAESQSRKRTRKSRRPPMQITTPPARSLRKNAARQWRQVNAGSWV